MSFQALAQTQFLKQWEEKQKANAPATAPADAAAPAPDVKETDEEALEEQEDDA